MKNSFLTCVLIALLSGTSSHAVKAAEQGQIVLLHGLLRSKASMEEMQLYFEARGYRIQNIDYPSTKHTMDALADMIAGHMRQTTIEDNVPVYMVGHSMGGVLIRLIAARHPDITITAAVELGSPNQGSRLASKLKDIALYQWVYGPAGQELAIEHFPYIPQVKFPVGVIAGNSTIDPISSTLLEGEDDGKVLLSETELPEATDRITLPVTHAFMMQNEGVMCQVEHFFVHHHFARDGECEK